MNITAQPGRYWGYAYLRSHAEKKAALSLREAGLPVYLPLKPKARLHHGTKLITQVPLLPGYLFLAADDFERSDLKRTDSRFVHIELLREPAAQEQFIRELNALRQCEELAQTREVLVRPGIQKGDRILVTGGSLKGLEAEVIRRDDRQDAVIINLELLETSVEFPVSLEYLKKISGC